VDGLRAAGSGGEAGFSRAVAEDPGVAGARAGLGGQLQRRSRMRGAWAALDAAKALADRATDRERAQIGIFELILSGRGAKALEAVRAHALDHPRDAMAVQPCVGVFGLIGFSGRQGREAEQLAFTAGLTPHYGEDWWMLGSHAFSQVEAGQTIEAAETVERSLAIHPRNANAAHYKAHIHYEAGETAAGYAYISDWRRDYPKEGMLHCHCSWHVALWALEGGDTRTMWDIFDADIAPGGAWGPPINVLSDAASILFRAELAGVEAPPERWKAVSDFAAAFFPRPGVAFADVHAALAHAMAGNVEALNRVTAEATGPAGDLVSTLGEAFGAIAAGRWAEAQAALARTLSDHCRIGGSRAQRDLIEYALLSSLLKQGKTDRARFMLATRRPLKVGAHAVAGL